MDDLPGPKTKNCIGPGNSLDILFYNGRKKLQDFLVSSKTPNVKNPLCTYDVYSDEVIPGPQVLGQGALDGTAYIRKASES